MEESRLVAECIRGNSNAWERLLETFGPAVHEAARFTLRRVLGAAQEEDVANVYQGVLLGLCDRNFHRLRLFQSRSTFKTWITSVTARFALNYIRSEKRKGSLKYAPLEEGAADQQPAADGPERLSDDERELLFQAIDRLPPRERLLIRLFYLDGLSYRAIGQVMKIPVNSISPLLMRAKETLKRSVSP